MSLCVQSLCVHLMEDHSSQVTNFMVLLVVWRMLLIEQDKPRLTETSTMSSSSDVRTPNPTTRCLLVAAVSQGVFLVRHQSIDGNFSISPMSQASQTHYTDSHMASGPFPIQPCRHATFFDGRSDPKRSNHLIPTTTKFPGIPRNTEPPT